MNKLRMFLITTALVAGSSALAAAQQPAYQGWGYQDRDRDWDRDHDRDRDRDRDRDWDRDRDRDRDGYYGRYGNRNYANARQFGYQDGFNDGRNDRATGHSFRPTHDSNYKHADRGYYGYGDRNYYKQMYRQAYEQGYQQGYNSGGYGRRRGWWW